MMYFATVQALAGQEASPTGDELFAEWGEEGGGDLPTLLTRAAAAIEAHKAEHPDRDHDELPMTWEINVTLG